MRKQIDGSAGCAAVVAADDRRALSANLGAPMRRIGICGNCCGIGIAWCSMRTRVMNQLHVVALNEGLRRKKALWRAAGRQELESIALARWANRRRQDLLDLLDQLTPQKSRN